MFPWSDVCGITCCLSDHRSGVIFAVVVVCQQKQQQQLQQQRQLQQQEWRPWEKRCMDTYVIDIVSVQEGLRLCVLKGGHVLCVVIVLETRSLGTLE